ncbi:MAG: hypothetical protein ACYDDZ_07185 [Acidimicrobiales bacterium]
MQVNVAWGKKQVTTFKELHSGHAHYVAQGGGSVTPPQYAKVMISQVPAYWQISPSPIAGKSGARSISALENGYVVTLTSTGLGQSQDERALKSIINRL